MLLFLFSCLVRTVKYFFLSSPPHPPPPSANRSKKKQKSLFNLQLWGVCNLQCLAEVRCAFSRAAPEEGPTN